MIRERQKALDALYTRIFGAAQDSEGSQPDNPARSLLLSDEEVLARCRRAANATKFLRLWAGDTDDHDGDDSAADLALLSLLSFWTQDPIQLDRLFRRSGLMREKWERADYRERTIDRALTRVETWEGAGSHPRLSIVGCTTDGLLGGAQERGTVPTPSLPLVSLPPVPPFPVDVLPDAIRRYVSEAAAAIGVPPELVAVPLLACAAACVGRTRRIVLKEGFEQRPILWAAVVGRPGTAKSPALAAAQKLIDALQAEAHERYELAMADYERELDEWKRAEAKGLKPVKPILQHFYTTDATKEALAAITRYAPGVVVVRDELSAWVRGFDAYRRGKGGDRQDFLSLWAGAGLKVDRKLGEPLYVPEPTVSVVGGIQPDLLPELAHEAGQDGFIDRILWAYPDAEPAKWSTAAVSKAATAGALAVFRQLRRPTTPSDDGRTLLALDAREAWARWHDDNLALTVAASPAVAGVYSKLTNQAARLALVLHCLWIPDDPARMVSRERVEDGIALAEYFRAHAHRALRHFGASPAPCFAGLSGRVLRILERREGWVTRTELHRALGNGVKAAELDDALTALESGGRAKRGTVQTATKGVERWRVVDEDVERMNFHEESPAPVRILHKSSFIRRETDGDWDEVVV
ncbi:MAG: YfjI family protein [Chloroflexota bacterium]|nr:YfjI family protein [Chloroflexota bacterium]